MTISFAQGSFQWNSADAGGTDYVVSSLGFVPKALMFVVMGLSGDGASQILDELLSIGFATATSDQRCVVAFDDDAAGTTVTGSGGDNSRVIGTGSATGFNGSLTLQSIDGDGFTCNNSDAPPVNLAVYWAAWGGDITAAVTGEISEPAATGNQDTVVTGSFQPDVVLFAGMIQHTSISSGAFALVDSGFGIGAATGPSNQFVVIGNNDQGSGSADTDGYCRDDECIATIAAAGGNPNARASFVQFNADGFRLNWIARAVTNRKTAYLAIAGGNWQAGSITLNTTAVNNNASVSGLSFTPNGVLAAGRQSAESTAGTSGAENRLSVGMASSVSDRRSMGLWSENGPTATEIDLVQDSASVLSYPTNAGAVDALYDVDQFNSDGFRITVDDAPGTGVAAEWIGYLTFGNVAAGGGDSGGMPWLTAAAENELVGVMQ